MGLIRSEISQKCITNVARFRRSELKLAGPMQRSFRGHLRRRRRGRGAPEAADGCAADRAVRRVQPLGAAAAEREVPARVKHLLGCK